MIRIENISKSFTDKILLKDITFHFPQNEKIALIGANGQGKTTLVNILVGLEYPNEGQIIKPKNLPIAFLPQSPNVNPEMTIRKECIKGHLEIYKAQCQMEMLLNKMAIQFNEEDYVLYEQFLHQFENMNGYELEGAAEKILLGLGFTLPQLDHSPLTLSGGWRMRLELAKTLVSRPEFLILDEPTNHLDLISIEWLESYLQTFRGTLLFISHDRSFLNNVATQIIHLKNGNLRSFKGNFDDFLDQQEQTKQSTEGLLKKLKQHQAHMQSFVDRFRAKPTKAGQVNSRKKSIAKLQEAIEGVAVQEEESKIHFTRIPFVKSGKDVFILKNLDIGYDQPLIKNISFTLHRGKKAAIIGKNGIGKSTFLKTLNGDIPFLNGDLNMGQNVKVGFYSQDTASKIDKSHTVYQALQHSSPNLSEQVIRGLLGQMLFKGHDTSKIVSVLSGGEKARLSLCCLLAQAPNCLLLDEPTNHLNIISTQLLANMLKSYEGTILFVSHDRDFINQIATDILEFEGKSINIYQKEG